MAVSEAADYLKHCDVKFRPQSRDSGWRLEPLAPDDRRAGVFYRGVAQRSGPGAPFNPHDPLLVEGAQEFLRHPPADQPFCLYLPLTFPHPAYAVTRDFYDRINPGELRNLAGRPEVGETERALQLRLLDFFMQTADILPQIQDSRRI